MNPNHTQFQENLPAYALGALDPEELAALEEHLQTCEICRAELAEYQRVSSGLMAALPPVPPPASVRRALQRQLAARAAPKRPAFSWSLGQGVVVGLIALMVVLNAMLVAQVYSLRRQQAELASQRTSDQTALAMLAYPSTKSLTFDENGVSGSLLVDKQRSLLAVFAWNLSSPPAGKTYQMWLIDPQGKRTSGGFLIPESGYPFVMAVIRSPKPLTDFTGFGVTLEPSGGSPQPTGPRILRVDF